MSDAVAIIVTAVLIALGMYAGKLHERRSGTGSKLKDKELEDAIKNVQSNLSSMSDTDLIRSIAEHGSVSKKTDSTNTPNS